MAKTGHYETRRHRATNRCPNCGHRLNMNLGGPNKNHCTVVTSESGKPGDETKCHCTKHRR